MSLYKKVEAAIKKLTWDECKEMLDGIDLCRDSFPSLEILHLNVLHAVVNGELHPRDILKRG
jgi:hypothetical protein